MIDDELIDLATAMLEEEGVTADGRMLDEVVATSAGRSMYVEAAGILLAARTGRPRWATESAVRLALALHRDPEVTS